MKYRDVFHSVTFLSAVGVMVKTQRFSDLIHQFGGFGRQSIVHIASLQQKIIPIERTRFTPLISNIRVLRAKYIRKISSPSMDYLTTSWAKKIIKK
jgi:hypothetical protein